VRKEWKKALRGVILVIHTEVCRAKLGDVGSKAT